MKTPLISMVVPTYNRGAYISRAVRSIQKQSVSNLEIIIVDDGSRDSTSQIVAEMSAEDDRIRWMQHAVNRGSQAARNTGIKAARGEWIAFLDSDDELLPSSLETRLTTLERQNVKVVHSDCYVEYASNHVRTLFGVRPLSGMVYDELLKAPGPVFPSFLLHANTLKAIDYLDETIVSYQEWDTAIRLAKRYEFGFVEEPTFIYHRHADPSISANLLRNARGYEQIVQRHQMDIMRIVGQKKLAYHYMKIAKYYLLAKCYRYVIRNSTLAIKTFLLKQVLPGQ